MTRIAYGNPGRARALIIRNGLSLDLLETNLNAYLDKNKSEKKLRPYYESKLLKILEKGLNDYFKKGMYVWNSKKKKMEINKIMFRGHYYSRYKFEYMLASVIKGYDTPDLRYIISEYERIEIQTGRRILSLISSYV